MPYSRDNFPCVDWSSDEIIIGCLDRIIELLEAQQTPKNGYSFTPEYYSPPPAVTCPKCGNPGGLSKPRAALGEPIMAACAPCAYAWIDTGDAP